MFTDEEMLQITNAINCGLQEFRGEFADFKFEVFRKFEAIDKRFEAIDKRFETIDKRFETIDKRFEAIDKRFETIDKRFEAIDKRFEAIDKKFEAIDKKFEAIDKKFEAIDKKFEAINKKIEAIDKRLDELAVSVNELKTNIVRDELVLKEVLETVNSSYGKYARSSDKVEWCDMQIRILGNVVSEHSEKLARVEEKIAEYEAGKKQD